MTNLYLCEYWNPREKVTPPDPRFVVRQAGADGRIVVEYDESVEVDLESLKPREVEVHCWKFGIITHKTAKRRSRYYIDTLVWAGFTEHGQARLVEKILTHLNGPFFNPDKIPVASGGSGGEWVSMHVPSELVIEFVSTEVEFAKTHGLDDLIARERKCYDFYCDRDPNFGYYSPRWDPPRVNRLTGEPKHADLLDLRQDYISRVRDWWQIEEKHPAEPMW